MASMGDLAFSMQMRDIVNNLVQEQIDTLRPRYRYATVKVIDRVNLKCDVIFNGELGQVRVNMGSIQPSAVNQVVRIEGIGTDKFITDVLGPAWNGHRYGVVDPLYSAGPAKVTWEGDTSLSGPYTLTVNNLLPRPGKSVIGIEVPGHGVVLASADDLSTRTADLLKADPINSVPLALQNGWVNYDGYGFGDPMGRYNFARATRTRAGIIQLNGLIKNGTATTGTLLFTLPANMRPAQQGIWMVGIGATSPYVGSVDIYPDGRVIARNCESAYVSLDNIKFPAADAAAWTPSGFSTNWANYSPGTWDTSAYWTDSNGIAWERGLIYYTPGGTPAAGSPMTTGAAVPNPARTLHRLTTATNGAGATQKVPTGQSLWIPPGTPSYFSLNGIPYPTAATTAAWYPAEATANGWTAYDTASFTAPGAWKTSDGQVHLAGLWKTASALGNGNMWQLPQGLRPRDRCLFMSLANPNAPCRIDVMPDGTIAGMTGVNAGWTSLDSLTFMAEN